MLWRIEDWVRTWTCFVTLARGLSLVERSPHSASKSPTANYSSHYGHFWLFFVLYYRNWLNWLNSKWIWVSVERLLLPTQSFSEFFPAKRMKWLFFLVQHSHLFVVFQQKSDIIIAIKSGVLYRYWKTGLGGHTNYTVFVFILIFELERRRDTARFY